MVITFNHLICLKHQDYNVAFGKFSSWWSCKMLRISCSWSLVWGWTPSLSSHRSTANLGWVVSCNLSNFCLYTKQEDVRALFLLTPPLVPVTYVLRIMILKVKGQVCCTILNKVSCHSRCQSQNSSGKIWIYKYKTTFMLLRYPIHLTSFFLC